MKIQWHPIISIIVVSVFLFLSCEKDNIIEGESDPVIEIQAFHKTSDNVFSPLVEAPVYVYIGLAPIDLTGYTYEGNGTYMNKDSVIVPDQTLKTDIEGRVTLYPGYLDIPLSVFVENTHSKMTSHSHWPYCHDNMTEKITFQ